MLFSQRLAREGERIFSIDASNIKGECSENGENSMGQLAERI